MFTSAFPRVQPAKACENNRHCFRSFVSPRSPRLRRVPDLGAALPRRADGGHSFVSWQLRVLYL